MKKQLREEALKRRDAVSLEERRKRSESITKHILSSEAYKKAKRIFTFVSMGSEVETRNIMETAWRTGKIVAVPKTEKGRRMYFLSINTFTDLKEGRFGVMEPVDGGEKELIPKADDLFLVPGALFDEARNRIGYGGGYYDTYFEEHKGFRKIGLAFSFQVQKAILPTEKTDVPLDDIVTENGWIGGKEQ